MRTVTVKVNGKPVTVKELKVRELRDEILPKFKDLFKDGANTEISSFVTGIEEKLSEIFPELVPVDLEEAYPSEIEALIEGWIKVNFFGVQKLLKPVISWAKTGGFSLPLFLQSRQISPQTSGESTQSGS
jgi:hypothetical protein